MYKRTVQLERLTVKAKSAVWFGYREFRNQLEVVMIDDLEVLG